MAHDIEKLIAALQKADAAGDTEAAKAIAAAIKQQQASPPAVPQQQPPAQPEMGLGDYLKRQAGLTGRAALEGANDIVSPFTNAAAWAMNQPLKWMGADYRFPEQSQNFSNLLTAAGMPEPETASEKAGNIGGRFIASMAAGGPVTKAVTKGLGIPTTTTVSQPSRVATIDELRTQANAAYKAAENAGVVIGKQSIARLSDDITLAANKAGFDADLHPRVAAALKRLATDSTDDISFEKAEILRRVIKNASASMQPDERRIAQEIVETFDDYIGRLGATDVVSGNAQRASTSITAARDFYTRLRKAETIEEMIDKARTNAPNFSASGLENTIRIQFKQLATNPKRLRLFTAAEQAAIKRVARGGPVGNLLRHLGKLAPTGVISGGISGGAGYAAAGPLGAVALPAAGLAARGGATALTQRNARLASELMRGPMTTGPQITQRSTAALGIPSAAGSLTAEEERRRRLTEALKR